ncbi:hypothetical protein [Pseudomonas sp.]|uniref:hypothetical protein n=1 Tax=Pseudomonas sp. TaxID=306 RepID=UPI0025839D09|nr:hypothetical protein [Pseudomonas sp.]
MTKQFVPGSVVTLNPAAAAQRGQPFIDEPALVGAASYAAESSMNVISISPPTSITITRATEDQLPLFQSVAPLQRKTFVRVDSLPLQAVNRNYLGQYIPNTIDYPTSVTGIFFPVLLKFWDDPEYHYGTSDVQTLDAASGWQVGHFIASWEEGGVALVKKGPVVQGMIPAGWLLDVTMGASNLPYIRINLESKVDIIVDL